ncbi:MAG: hypothetical protein KAI17_06950, partial [Thiotrichaceae bacterium]|nr:hypothetical protein [Thiotrichaceae bacterium]
MTNKNKSGFFLLILMLLFYNGTLLLAETAKPAEETVVTDKTVKEKTAVEIKHTDTTEAGKAAHAFMEPNLCEGMAEGSFLGADTCADCHQDKIETMHNSPHGQSVDKRTPFG